jgi:hypothetical protein
LILDDGGAGYTSSPTFTIPAPTSGTTATGTAAIQATTAILVAEEAQQFPPDNENYALYLNVVRVYETLPGPPLNGAAYQLPQLTPSEFIESISEVITEQKLASDAPTSDLTGEGSTSVVTPIDSVAAKREDRERTITYADGPFEGERVGEWGVETTSKERVDEGDPADSGAGVRESRVTPIGGGSGKAIKETVRFPDPDPDTGVIAVHNAEIQDAGSGIVIDIQKAFVTAEKAADYADAMRSSTWIAKVDDYDQEHSIVTSMMARAGTMPVTAQEFYGSVEINLPDILTNLTTTFSKVHEESSAYSTSTSGPGQDSASVSAEVSGAIQPEIKSGVRGKVRARILRTYQIGKPQSSDITQVTLIQPTTGYITIKDTAYAMNVKVPTSYAGSSWQFTTSGSSGVSARTSVRMLQIGPVIVAAAVTVNSSDSQASSKTEGGAVASVTATSTITGAIPVSSPTTSSFDTGDELLWDIIVREMEANVYAIDHVYAIIP